MGYFTTGDAATEAEVSSQTVRNWMDDGLLECSVSEGGTRRVHESAMRRIRAANDFIHTYLESSAAHGELVGAVLRLLAIPAPYRLGACGFVQGFLVARLGVDVKLRVKPGAKAGAPEAALA